MVFETVRFDMVWGLDIFDIDIPFDMISHGYLIFSAVIVRAFVTMSPFTNDAMVSRNHFVNM